MRVAALYRYPVKGFTAEECEALSVLEGGRIAGDRGASSTVYNLGNSVGYSVREVIELASNVSNRDIPVIEDRRRPGDPAVLVANADKIKRSLGWSPRYEALETIIRTAWDWHRHLET